VANDKQLKYGWIRGGKVSIPVPIGNGEVIHSQSGRFVKNDASGRAEIAGDTNTVLWGFLECEDIAAADNTSEGKYTRNMIIDLTAVFRIPIRFESATYTVNYSAAVLGKSCDLVVADGDIQWANLTDGDESTIVIVGGKAASAAAADDGWVDVMLNPAKLSPTAL